MSQKLSKKPAVSKTRVWVLGGGSCPIPGQDRVELRQIDLALVSVYVRTLPSVSGSQNFCFNPLLLGGRLDRSLTLSSWNSGGCLAPMSMLTFTTLHFL